MRASMDAGPEKDLLQGVTSLATHLGSNLQIQTITTLIGSDAVTDRSTTPQFSLSTVFVDNFVDKDATKPWMRAIIRPRTNRSIFNHIIEKQAYSYA